MKLFHAVEAKSNGTRYQGSARNSQPDRSAAFSRHSSMPLYAPKYRHPKRKKIAARCARTLAHCLVGCLLAWSHSISADLFDDIFDPPENPMPRLPEEIPAEFDELPSDNPLSDAKGYLILGVATRPEWHGANSEPGNPFFISRFALPDVEISLEGLDWYVDVLPSPIWRAGVTASLESGREASGFQDSDLGADFQDVPDLGFGAALGPYAGFEMPNTLLPEGLASARISTRSSAVGKRTGHSLTLDADYFFAATFMWRIGVAAKVTITDAAWVDTRFGVSESTAALTGLSQFSGSGGIHSIGTSIYTIVSLSPRFGLFGRVGRTRLLNSAARSPIITRFGNDVQRFAGLGLFYLF